MNRVIKIERMRLHQGQQDIVNGHARFTVAACGRRFGKSKLACYWLMLSPGAAIDGKPVAYFAPTYKLLLDIWSDSVRILRPMVRKANRTDMRIELITGGKIDFWTLEDVDAGRGRKYARVVIDEAAHSRNLQEAWERAISPTLTDMRGHAWFISTPRGLNFFHDLYKRGGTEAYPGWNSFRMPSTTNPWIDPEEIESKRPELPELVFRQEFEAEFVTFGAGLVKPDHVILGAVPPKLPVVMGVDLAISEKQSADWTAIVTMSRDPATGIVYVIEAERYRCGFNDALNHVKDTANRYKPIMIAIEQTQYQAAVIQELTRTTKLPVRGIHPDRDKLTRFAPLLTRYEQGKVRHDPSKVPNWFRDELLAFPDKGQHDDGVDAASYAFQALPATGSGTFVPVKPQPSTWL